MLYFQAKLTNLKMCFNSVVENAVDVLVNAEFLIKELILVYKDKVWAGFFKFLYCTVNFPWELLKACPKSYKAAFFLPQLAFGLSMICFGLEL